MNQATIKKIDESLKLAVGRNLADEPVESGGVGVFSWLVNTGQTIPPWWSQARDIKLASIWKASNHLSLAVYNTQAKIVGIPFKIVARDLTNMEHVEEAAMATDELMLSADFARGWPVTWGKFVESLLTQDNGAFMEIIGDGDPSGPIIGRPVSVRHLDSSRCRRTGHPVYPVIYTDTDSKLYKLHWTRVIFMAQMESPIAEMNGVGLCAVSRSIEIAQTLNDMVRYKQERLGSRPHNQILVGKGVTGTQIMKALRMVETELHNRGLARYASTVAIGSENPNISIERIDLNHMEPFDEEISTTFGMFAIAAAFGMDADEIWPVTGKSASKGEANLRRMRSRGRLPAQITQEIALQFNFKYLPRHLMMAFDFKDDEEDMQRANIRDIRGRNRERDLGTGAINVHAARVNMMRDGDIDRELFEDMELSDGRLPDGKPISILFLSDEYDDLLNVGDAPLSINSNDADEMIDMIQENRSVILREWARTSSKKKSRRMENAFYALDWLEEQYLFASGKILPPVPMQQRRMRTDIRVEPEETSPAQGEQSPAQASQVIDENVPGVGGE